MNKEILRLRMFAGPNGSGKSTFKSIIRPELLGIFTHLVSRDHGWPLVGNENRSGASVV